MSDERCKWPDTLSYGLAEKVAMTAVIYLPVIRPYYQAELLASASRATCLTL